MRKILEEYEDTMVMIKGKYIKKWNGKYYLFGKIVVYKNGKKVGIEDHINELEIDFEIKPKKFERKRNYFLTSKVTRYRRINGTEDLKITEVIVDFI